MKKIIAIVFLGSLLTGCSVGRVVDTFNKMGETLEQNKDVISELRGKTNEILNGAEKVNNDVRSGLESMKEVLKAADTDGDGKLGWMELLIALGGGGGLAAARNAKSAKDKAKAALDNALAMAELEKRIALLEVTKG
jgi:hypothetical protein